MHELMIIGLIGEKGFTEVLIGLPDEFFDLHRPAQEALWQAILGKINDGERDIAKLILFASEWLKLFRTIYATSTPTAIGS